jgi:hypothetical protein
MHPLISQALAAERIRDMQQRASAARLAAEARRGRRPAYRGTLAMTVQALRISRGRTLARYRSAQVWKLRPSR